MRLRDRVASVWSTHGLMAKALPTYHQRDGQQRMAEAVADTIDDGGILVVEAGTGVGKTFAYLVPALLSGERVLVSTATKALQDQLAGRDLPRLLQTLALPARVALLKGRSSYLCLYRLEQARHADDAHRPEVQRDLAQVESWAACTRTGDLAELPMLDEGSDATPLVTSTRENCLGGRCPNWQDCHVNQARRNAMAADVVVVNHHLFFADLVIRESGVAELLPTMQTVVFDEAHQLNDIGVQFLSRRLGLGALERLCKDLAVYRGLLSHADGDWSRKQADLGDAVWQLREWCLSAVSSGGSSVDLAEGAQVLAALHQALQSCEMGLRALEETVGELMVLRERVSRLMGDAWAFASESPPNAIRWIEGGRQPALLQTPLTVSTALQAFMDAAGAGRRCWVFTSATLGYEPDLRAFLDTMGLVGRATVLQVHSPFDYASQACLYVPSDMPSPGGTAHSTAVAELVASSAAILGGRTLVLTTSLRAMREIAAHLRQRLTAPTHPQVRVQGESSKRVLTEELRQSGPQGAAGLVLVACVAFWEGIDIPGDALQLVVIDKLPFTPPDDPVVQARAAEVKAQGGNPFMQLHVPQAAIVLKQGAGRLIRSESDQGVLVVCDVRLVEKPYGRKILSALPPMRRLEGAKAYEEALQALTRPSTTAR